MTIQKTRYIDKFDFELSISADLDPEKVKIPSMLLQPFIENAIEHGFKNLGRKGEIKIEFTKEYDELHVILRDNGVGFRPDENHKTYPSRATQIIQERIALMNEKMKTDARFSLISIDSQGTEVSLYLPILV